MFGRTPDKSVNCSQLCLSQRYLQHYYTKQCKPIYDDRCGCPKTFDCNYDNLPQNQSVCHFEGRIYRIGSTIVTQNPCRICDCRQSGHSLARIDCSIAIECPESAFGLKPEPNCYFAYRRDKCCGEMVCPKLGQPKRDIKVCRYKSKDYRLGEKIYPEEDMCMTCICTDDWLENNPLKSKHCYRQTCDLQLNSQFTSGCLPVYHESTCCPIDYICDKQNKQTDRLTKVSNLTVCLFNGNKYPIGHRLQTDNPCVECQCSVPPDMTCIHKSCPTPQSNNCYVGVWDHHICCQKYNCN
ncbi:kielin/chordin-like protein [Oppia nitens]|uniref:kielin/chordin-like protein n=1 Tax=Oppia nitens TaxID=1686743 RepID=UPI0023DA48DE|nr:kielin/chordin-like protein [Oppia nitens]